MTRIATSAGVFPRPFRYPLFVKKMFLQNLEFAKTRNRVWFYPLSALTGSLQEKRYK